MGLAGLIGCGGGSTTSDTAAASYRISGSVVGLTTGGLVLSNAGSTIGVAAGADRFAFDTSFTGSYRVTVLAQPDGQTCSVRSPGGSGGADVTAMQVVCRGYAAYVAHEDSQTLAQFSVAEDGSLTAMAAPTLALTYQPAGLVLRGDGAFAWLRYGNHRQVTALAADAVSGALSLVGHAPSYSAGYGLVLHPELDVLYSADYGGAALSQFSLDSRGLPVALTVPRLATEINPKAVVVSPDGAWVFVANASSESVSQYSVGSSGALAIPTLPTVASVSLAAYGSGPSALAVDPTGSRLFVLLEGSHRLLQYGIGNSGLSYERRVATGSQPVALVVTPDGAHAFVANRGDNSLTMFTLAGGAVTSLGPLATCSTPTALAVSPDGRHLYVACAGDDTVQRYAIASDGLLTAAGSVASGGQGPSAIAVR